MKSRPLTSWILLADLIWAALALPAAVGLRYGFAGNRWNSISTQAMMVFLAATWILWTLLSSWMQLDGFRGGWHFPAVMSRILMGISCLMAALLACGYLLQAFVSRLALTYFGILLLIGFAAVRLGARLVLVRRYRRNDISRVVIAGSDPVARELALKIGRHPEMLCKVIGFLCLESSADAPSQTLGEPLRSGARSGATLSTLGIVEFLNSENVNELIFALSQPAWAEMLNLARHCRGHGIGISMVPQPYELYLSKPLLLDLDGLPLFQLGGAQVSPARLYAKRILDAGLGAILAVLAAPLVLASALALRRTSITIFERRNRCGQYGRTFGMYRLNVERGIEHGPWLERLLDRLSVTELPQLWNVLRGEMSLVGPRPDSPERVKCYSEWQRERLSVKPGLTGLAQVHGLRDQNSSEEKTRFDLQYRLNPSLLTDISLLLQTVWTLAGRVLSYSKRAARTSQVPRQRIPRDSKTQFLEETLSHAHCAQSSTD